MYTQEQILDMYFERNQQAVSATSQMYGAKLTRFADTMIAHEDALECVKHRYVQDWSIRLSPYCGTLTDTHPF